MSDLADIFINFLSSISQVDVFQYAFVSIGVFGVTLLVRKIIYA